MCQYCSVSRGDEVVDVSHVFCVSKGERGRARTGSIEVEDDRQEMAGRNIAGTVCGRDFLTPTSWRRLEKSNAAVQLALVGLEKRRRLPTLRSSNDDTLFPRSQLTCTLKLRIPLLARYCHFRVFIPFSIILSLVKGREQYSDRARGHNLSTPCCMLSLI